MQRARSAIAISLALFALADDNAAAGNWIGVSGIGVKLGNSVSARTSAFDGSPLSPTGNRIGGVVPADSNVVAPNEAGGVGGISAAPPLGTTIESFSNPQPAPGGPVGAVHSPGT